MKEIIIVTSFSDSFVPVAGVAFFSMMKNSNLERKYRLIILDDELKEEGKFLFKKSLGEFKNLEIDFKKIPKDDILEASFKARNVTNVTVHTYYRLNMSKYFSEYSKVLYLDPDIIVLDDVGKLYDTDISEYHIGAVKDINFHPMVERDSAMIKYYTEDLKLTQKQLEGIFNGGVQLQNLDLMRQDKVDQKILDLLLTRKFYWVVDQDIINLAVSKIYYFDKKWNRHGYSFTEPDKLIQESPSIIHYTTVNLSKPWQAVVTAGFDVFDNIFWQYAKQTLFYEMLLNYNHFAGHINSLQNNMAAFRSNNNTLQPKTLSFIKRIFYKLELHQYLYFLKHSIFSCIIRDSLKILYLTVVIPFRFFCVIYKKIMRLFQK